MGTKKLTNEQKLKKSEYYKTYKELNYEKELSRLKTFYSENKEQYKEYSKTYREVNKEQIAAKRKAKYDANKEQIAAKRKAKYDANKVIKVKPIKEIKPVKIKIPIDNKTKIAARKKAYREANKERYKEYYKKYREINKERLSKAKNDWAKNERATNPLYKLKINTRTLVGQSIRKKGYTKNSKTQAILGCSFEDFKQHLESKFEPWMTWNNYGLYNGELNYGWDIDHVIPNSSGITEDEIIQLNHYTNLQPLCSKINRDIKRNNIV